MSTKRDGKIVKIIQNLMQTPASRLGALLDLTNKLKNRDGVGIDTHNLLCELNRGSIDVRPVQILNRLDTTTISATTEKFVAKEKFCKDSKEVKFYGFYGSFGEDFLAGDGKVEEVLVKQKFRYRNLTKDSVDGPIIEELGGEAKAETTLIELYDLLKKQGNGREGDLLTNRYANIFYIRNSFGVLRSVGVNWSGGGWGVDAGSVEDPGDWVAGNRVFYRNY